MRSTNASDNEWHFIKLYQILHFYYYFCNSIFVKYKFQDTLLLYCNQKAKNSNRFYSFTDRSLFSVRDRLDGFHLQTFDRRSSKKHPGYPPGKHDHPGKQYLLLFNDCQR